MMNSIALQLWLLAATFFGVSGLIHHLDIRNDRRSTFEIETFGFVENGIVNITIRDFSFNSAKSHHGHRKKDYNHSNIETDYQVSLLLRPASSETEAQKDLEKAIDSGKCLLDFPRENDVVMDLSPALTTRRIHLHKSIPAGGGGLYSLIFVRCKPASTSYHANFKMDAVFVNPGPNYLPAGEAPFPKMYFALFIIYTLCFFLWCWVILYSVQAKSSNHMHYMMAALMALKCLTLLTESVRFHYIALTGVSEGWSIMYYIFTSLKSIMLFLVILLIGSGWAHVKPFLHTREKNIILVVLILQVIDNIAMIVIEETSPGSIGWLTWRDILHIVDIMCCCAMLFPIFWSINHFRQAAESDGKARDSLHKLQLFRQFYVMVLTYIYFSRVIVYLLTATMPFHLQWLGQLCLELGTLLFFAITGCKFQPASESLYTRLSTEDAEGEEYGLIDYNQVESGSTTSLALREAFSGDCDQDL